jgi:serine protease Do
MVSQTPLGATMKIKVLRQKKELEMEVSIAELPKKMAESSSGEQDTGGNEEESGVLSGLAVRELTPDLARRFGLEENEKGVVVLKVDPASRLSEAGIRAGDVILQINQKNVPTLQEYIKAASKIQAGERTLLLVRRKGQDLFITIKPE